MSLLDDVFEILQTATLIEKSGENRIEAATKYYEAVYLMRQVLSMTPQEAVDTRDLLEEKIQLYSAAASRLYFDDSSTAPSAVYDDPRSPYSDLSRQGFFQEEVTKPSAPRTCQSPRFTQTAALNKKASIANSKLAQAIENDEAGKTKQAIDLYMSASELYLETIRMCQSGKRSTSIAPVLTRRLEGAMDRIEQLKTPNKTILKQRKTNEIDNRSQFSGISSLTQDEINVLKRSSLIASGLFLPWSDKEANALSSRVQAMTEPSGLFTDKDGDLELSRKQRKRFHRWARPREIAKVRSRSMGGRQCYPSMIQRISPYNIRQQCVTDCSFIASLCICAAFEKRFRKRLITSIIYPQSKDGIPIYNPEGKYIVKLWLNGVARQVIVDDRLPIDQHSNLLCSHTSDGRNGSFELWVSIIEKAYMKLCGGYDFPGSNSGVDLFSLTGWIPERIFFPQSPLKVRDFETSPERAWDRLFSANSFGDCLITVSTTRDLTEEKADALGLVTGHAYAVLEVFQSRDGTRLLQLKNPWASKSWKGRYSPQDRESWQKSTLKAELGYDPDLAAKHDDGIFWICWEDVLLYFQNIQLSWNPGLFSHRVTTHKFWPRNQGPPNDTFNVGENPQYVMVLSDEAVSKAATVWVMLSRHVTKQEQEGAEANDFLTIHLLRNTERKERLFYPHGKNSLVNGAYSNNPHVLVRYDIAGPQDKYISLVLSQHQKSHDLGYTLSCFCTEPFAIVAPERDLPVVIAVSGSWTAETAAGPVGRPEFLQNPMHSINVSQETELQLRCSTMKSYAVNVMLFQAADRGSKDLRVRARKYGSPILDSGNYRHGFTVTERTKIKPGTYVFVVSTFHAGNVGTYSVDVACSKKGVLTINRVP